MECSRGREKGHKGRQRQREGLEADRKHQNGLEGGHEGCRRRLEGLRGRLQGREDRRGPLKDCDQIFAF